MSEGKEQERNPRISLSRSGSRLELTKTVDSGMVRQSFSHGRSKSVAVEVKKKRNLKPGGPARQGEPGRETEAQGQARGAATSGAQAEGRSAARSTEAERGAARRPVVLKPLTDEEKTARVRALADARRVEEEARRRAEENARRLAAEEARRRTEEEAADRRKSEEEARKKAEEEARRKAEEAAARLLAKEDEERRRKAEAEGGAPQAREAKTEAPAEPAPAPQAPAADKAEPARAEKPAQPARAKPKGKAAKTERTEGKGEGKRLGLGRRERGRVALSTDEEEMERRARSLASLRRQREKRHATQTDDGQIVREVVLPEAITVAELANRMAVRGADVVKQLMKMGVMATVNQAIDAETAELVVSEFGHRAKRVSEADVEIGLEGETDAPEDLVPRAPVVTVMGHVDHGKTSLLDALRHADVAAHEAGGITQHIGAYQVDLGTGHPVTFIDTPGHAAFSEMRARGAQVTDVVVLVVAADDGVMPQTVEAIRHAQAAHVPIVVAVNKIDRPDADPDRVKQELLKHEVVAEEFGGDVLCVEVSATQKQGLDTLIETLSLQAEILDLKANPNRAAQGVVVEARLDRGRGVVATILIERGTLQVGDIVVCGAHSGKVRALVNDRGAHVNQAGPAQPVEILGLDGVPDAGDHLVVVENERRAREITEYRQRKRREQATTAAPRTTTVEEMFSQLKAGETKELPVVVKSDVHGSLEAITTAFANLATDEVSVRVLHAGVGGITESDVTLALASKALIIGFNVRANAQARELARHEGVDIRYYAIIYELIDDIKGMLSGMLAPLAKENTLGHAEIREVFSISKVGKVAGCRVIDGVIRRGAKARLLRDDVVVHDGALGSLKRFKDDVREVREGFECGIGLEGFNDIREGDVVEAYEIQEVARQL